MTCPENAVAEWERSGWEREKPAVAAVPAPASDPAPTADTPPATGRRGGRGATPEKES